MAVYKDQKKGTWYTSFHYKDWTGKNCRKLKRGFATKKEALEWETSFLRTKASKMDMTFGEFVTVYEQDSWDNVNNPFELINLQSINVQDSSSEADVLEQCVKRVCRMNPKAYVSEVGERYNVLIEFQNYEDIDEIEIYLMPLRSNKSAKVSKHVEIHELEILQLSQFYRLVISGKDTKIERIVMIPTTGLPEERENQVVQSIVANKKTFIEYVAFVLGDDYLLSIIEAKRLADSGIYNGREGMMMPAVYEKMLKTSLEEPEKLGEINYLMKMIDDEDIIPDEFRKMYETFKTTLKLK